MSKSIIQDDYSVCFLCGGYNPTEEHHIFGGSNRKHSEKYGLKVKLHHNCHNEPPKGVHHNKQIRIKLQSYAQRIAMEHYGWSLEEWLSIFGRNYLEE